MEQLKQVKQQKQLLNKSIGNVLINLEETDPDLSKKLKKIQNKINSCQDSKELNSICVNLTQLINKL